MNPARFSQMMKYLTRAKKEKPDLPDVFPASKAPIPPKTQNVEEIEAVNQFMLRNPRADGGRIPFGEGSITKVQQLSKVVKQDPKLVDLFNKGELYHIRTTVGAEGGPKDRRVYRGTKQELKEVMKQRQSTGKPVKLTAKMKTNIKEFEKKTGEKYETLNADKKKRVRDGSKTVGTLPSREEMKNRISIKQKGNAGVIEDVIFPNPKMKEKFLNELELKYTYVSGKSMPEKFKAVNFAKRYPISERQFERMVGFYVNKKGLTYPKGGESAQVLAKRKNLQKKVTGIKTENTIVDKIKKPILKEKNLSNKIDLAHRVSMEHMARLGLEYDTRLLGMDSRLINQAIVKPAEFKLSKLYEKQFDLMKKIEKSGLTTELKDELTDINDRVKKTIKTTSGRLFGITVDPKTLEPFFEGIDKRFSLASEDINLKELDKLPRKERIKILSPYVSKKVNAEIKRGFRPADFKEILQDKGSREQVLRYVKKFAPDILGQVEKAVANPASKESFALYSNPVFNPEMFRKLSPTTRKLVGGAGGLILPEVLFYQIDKRNRMSKGVSEKEAAAGALESGTLGAYTDKAYMEELKKVADSMDIDSGAFDSAYNLNILSKSYEQNSKNVDAQIATALENQDVKTAEELRLNFNKYLARIKPEAERLRNDIEERVTGGSPRTMAMGRGNVTEEQYSKPFYDMQDVAMEKLKKEKQSVFPKIQTKYNPAEGSMGTGFFNVFDSLTQGAKNLIQGRVVPYASKIGLPQYEPKASERQITTQELKNMDPRELQRFNLGRGFTYDNPVRPGDIETLQYEQPGVFFAGGGIAKLAGVDQGPPPVRGPNSQGLLSLKNRVRNY